MGNKQKVMVSERALFARINRLLQKDGMFIRRCREDSQSAHVLGRYFVIDAQRNCVVEKDIDLEQLGRDRGVLAEYEVLAE